MNSILEALANDNLCFNPATYKNGTEYAKAIKAAYKTAEELDGKLNDEERKLFEQFQDTHSDAEKLYAVERFVCGFRVAALMMFEVFAAGKDEFILSKGANE